MRRDAPGTPLPWPDIACALFLFIAASAVSFLDYRLAVAACAAVFGLAAWRDPDLSLCLFVFSLPFDRLFHLQEQPGLILLGMQMLMQLGSELRHGRVALSEFGRTDCWRYDFRQRLWPWFAVFVLLAIVHQSPTVDTIFWLKTVAFGLPALMLLIFYDGALAPRSWRAVIVGLFTSVAFQLCFDLALRAGAFNLVLPPDSLRWDSTFNGRLSGLTLNANFLASILLAAFCFVYAALLVDPRRHRWAKLLLLTLLYAGVAQTVSKGFILASFFVILATIAGLLMMRERAIAGHAAAIAAGCILLVVATVVLPPLMIARPVAGKMSDAAAARPPRPPLSAAERLERKLRINYESSLVERNGKLVWQTAECETLCAGQRTRLWTAGWRVIRDHWLVGIGFGGWQSEMKRLLEYPFSSPHNATLHLWGLFGLAGLALNLGLYIVILRRLMRFGDWLGSAGGQIAALATGTYLAMSIVGETVETTEILSLSRFGLFIWIMLALHTSSVRSITATATATARPAQQGS